MNMGAAYDFRYSLNELVHLVEKLRHPVLAFSVYVAAKPQCLYRGESEVIKPMHKLPMHRNRRCDALTENREAVSERSQTVGAGCTEARRREHLKQTGTPGSMETTPHRLRRYANWQGHLRVLQNDDVRRRSLAFS